MLQLTALRTPKDAGFDAPIIVAGRDHAAAAREQLEAIGADVAATIVEPAARNTAPAIAIAALSVERDTLLLVMPSDHVVSDTAAFRAGVQSAASLAADGWLVTFGVKPSSPETGYGYIRLGQELGGGICKVERFVEKPDLATAATYIAEGRYVWNGGIFLFRAGSFLAALAEHAPAVLAAAEAAMVGAHTKDAELHPDAAAFGGSPNISIDYAVMEKAERIAVVPIDVGWSDIGCWDALYEVGEKDAAGNVAAGETLLMDAEGCLVRSVGPRIVTLGVKDLIVIATGDAVLVIPRGESQKVKEAVDALRTEGSLLL